MIDSPDNLKEKAVYLVGGTKDHTIKMFAVEAAYDVLTNQGVTKLEFLKKPIRHDAGGSKPIDGIKYIYTQLGYAPDGFNEPSTDPESLGTLSQFDQREFLQDGWTWEETTLKDFGYVYVPHTCKTKSCNVHFVFHGCNADSFAQKYGYNEFAATNDIIMVYPDSPCWGYIHSVTDDKQFTRDGMMPKTIMSMVERVTST